MPRQARIDIPGQLYHVMSRGIERREIFLYDEDYSDFKERIAVWLAKTGSKCLAWSLMPNHFHLLVLRGVRPLSEMMHHAMTGYAINFNLRHRRAGHLFQNRYKAILCDLEGYLLQLVPYIHLNPLRARIVKNLAELEGYKWCGHCAAVGGPSDGILARNELLAHFGDSGQAALEKYRSAIAENAATTEKQDLSGGGMLRSFGGANAILRSFRAGEKAFSDQRILGESDFVESVLRAAGETMKKRNKSRTEVIAEVENITGINRRDIFRRTRERGPAQARAIYCYLCKERGESAGKLMHELGIGQSAVSRLASRGQVLSGKWKIII